MNKLITLAALGLCFSSINAQEAKEEKKAEEGFVFTTIKENPITSIKNQNRSLSRKTLSHLSRTRTVPALAGRSHL